jgi:hypothetical protein
MGKDPIDVKEIDSVEREIDALRARTEALLAELEQRVSENVERARGRVDRVKSGLRRAREITDVPAQARAHPRAAAGVGAGTTIAIGLGVWFLVARWRHGRQLSTRFRRRASAYRALLADPERALAPRVPSLGRKLLTALLVTLATTVVRRLATKGVERALPA